jgi:hypothetical protein
MYLADGQGPAVQHYVTMEKLRANRIHGDCMHTYGRWMPRVSSDHPTACAGGWRCIWFVGSVFLAERCRCFSFARMCGKLWTRVKQPRQVCMQSPWIQYACSTQCFFYRPKVADIFEIFFLSLGSDKIWYQLIFFSFFHVSTQTI